jgi:signal transduction histidine kinase
MGFSIAGGSVALACAFRLALNPLLGDSHQYTFFFAAIALTSWFAGFWPTVVAIALGYALADWFFVAPRYALDVLAYQFGDFVGLGGFVLSGLAIAFTSKALHAAKIRAEQKHTQLLAEIEDRQRVQNELEAAKALLQQHASILEQQVAERTANLRQTVESLEGVCYHIAHDLRAPLRTMSCFSSLLLADEPGLSSAARVSVKRVIEAAERMDLLSRSLIEYGQLSQQALAFENLDLGEIVEEVLQALVPVIQLRSARVTTHGPLPFVWADRRLAGEILTELVSNALKFVPAGTTPDVVICSDLEKISVPRVAVIDNGLGLCPAHQHNLFKIFHRLHASAAYPGAGMGLAKVSKAVQRMGGRVGVVSELHKGSRFWVELPPCRRENVRSPRLIVRSPVDEVCIN